MGDAAGVGVGVRDVSVTDGDPIADGEGDAVGEGEGVGEGWNTAIGWVAVGRTTSASSSPSRKLPSNIPTLMSVMAMPTASCPMLAGWPTLERRCSLTPLPPPPLRWQGDDQWRNSPASGRCHPRAITAG